MRKFFILALLAIVFAASLISWRSGDSPIQMIEQDYRNSLNEFSNSVLIFKASAKSSSLDQLKKDYINLRISYKNIQSFLEYYSPQAAGDFLNGPPVPKLERNTAVMTLLEPKGIQVLDEILYGDDPLKHRKEIIEETDYLLKKFNDVKEFQLGIKMQDRHFFEAARFEIVRILTLGISGFDTPSSQLSFIDLDASLLTLSRQYDYYEDMFKKEKKTIFKETQKLLKDAIDYSDKHKDFDSFDRFEFIVDYLNPIYGKLLESQLALGIETIYEVQQNKYSTNYLAKNIFADDFLNPYFYTELLESKDSDKLRNLGMKLFFDPALSEDNKRACASCHDPKLAFTDGYAKSMAFGKEGTVQRNAPTLINSVFAARYFYDMRVENLENQFEHVVTNDKEFHTDFPRIIEKLNGSKEYKKMFKECFPEYKKKPISRHTIDFALASYVLSLRSFNSPFDQYIRGEKRNIPNSVRNGFNVFMGKGKCATCHFPPTFAGLIPPYFEESESEVLGVPISPDTLKTRLDPDLGRRTGLIKERSNHFNNSFKIMTVRNIEHTAPYMHNGVYNTLEEVIDFYNRGGGIGLGFDMENQTLPSDPLNLTDLEIKDLVAFMNSLTDTSFYDHKPESLPKFDKQPELNDRPIGGSY